jgi:hypothetical protein
MCIIVFGIGIVQADDLDLMEEYAPIYQFTENECCYPVDVEYFLTNSDLYEFSDGQGLIYDANPTSESIGNISDDTAYYLDNMLGSILDDGVIVDYQNKISSLGYTVYGNLIEDDDFWILQYWTFYTFNKGSLNVHEGDWELVQVVLRNNSPVEAMFSQHHSGMRANWEQVDKQGDHLIVYVAEGTHANYVRSYSGRFGVANDVVGDNGRRLSINDYDVELLSSQGWLDFSGHWGYYGGPEDEIRGKAGPVGPKFRESSEMWSSAYLWGQGLSPADNNIFIFEWLMANFLLIFILLTVLTLVIILVKAYRRHIDYGLGPRKLSILYIDGANRKSIGNILCIVGIILAVVALFSPWYVVSGVINVPGHETKGFVDLISIDGLNGIQVNLLDQTIGVVPLSVFILPFSLIIGIGLILLIIGTLGISSSRKLARKYMSKGVRLMVPIILILVAFLLIGNIVNISDLAPSDSSTFGNVLSDVSSSPWGGSASYLIPEYVDMSASVSVEWGLGNGGILLLAAGIILLIAGFFENVAKVEFYKEKTIDETLDKIAAKYKKDDKISLNEELNKEKRNREKRKKRND